MTGKPPSSPRSRSWSVESTEPDIWCISREHRGPVQLPDAEHDPGLVAASIAWDFAVPPQLQVRPVDLDHDLEVLAAAVELSDRHDYRRNRRAHRRWVREFNSGTVTKQEAVGDAVEELEELVAEQHELVRGVWVDRAVRTGFLLGTVTLGLVAGPLIPVALAGAAWLSASLPVGIAEPQAGSTDSQVAAMYCTIDRDIRKKFFDGHHDRQQPDLDP